MLNWILADSGTTIIYSSSVIATDEHNLQLATESLAKKSVELLPANILSDSHYLLFEWDANNNVLTCVVTNPDKNIDSPIQVKCNFTGLSLNLNHLDMNERMQAKIDTTESMRFWLHDYLASCSAFFNYSLVAIFHSSIRTETELL